MMARLPMTLLMLATTLVLLLALSMPVMLSMVVVMVSMMAGRSWLLLWMFVAVLHVWLLLLPRYSSMLLLLDAEYSSMLPATH